MKMKIVMRTGDTPSSNIPIQSAGSQFFISQINFLACLITSSM